MEVLLPCRDLGKGMEKDIPAFDGRGVTDGRHDESTTGQSQVLTHAVAGCGGESFDIDRARHYHSLLAGSALSDEFPSNGFRQCEHIMTAT